jgi:hypothetical protein
MNKKLKAAHSHFIAERDRLIAELDILLNGQTGSESLDRVFHTFREMAVVNTAISNIESILADNEQENPLVSGLTIDQLGEMNRMAEAIRQKMNDGENKNQDDA